MARLSEEIIRTVQESVDIVDVVSRYVTLKRTGKSFKGLCPFHEEKTPSFHVFPDSGRFKCFGCSESGDVLGFLMKRGNLGFREVIEELARESGVDLPADEELGPEDAERARGRADALDALAFAAQFYQVVLGRDAGAAARAYLHDRGFDDDAIAHFCLGYSPDDYEGLLGYATGKGITSEALVQAGLARRNDRGKLYDMFRGRIMFPIHDLRGRVIGFGARAMGDAQPKYLNSPDGPLFHKGREMYGLHLARDAARLAGRLLVVEGYTDVMQCHQAGVPEVAAGLGTALSAENAGQLRRFGVPIHLVYDGDEAGLRAAERAADLFLESEVEGAVVLLPPGQDPADLVRNGGREALEAALTGARDLWDYRVERAIARNGEATLESRQRGVRELLDVIGRMKDPVRQNVAFRLLEEKTGVPQSTLRNQTRAPTRSQTRSGTPVSSSEDETGGPVAWIRAEKDLIAAAMDDSGVWDRLARLYPPDRFRNGALRVVAGAISDLRQRGESVTREALLGVLADQDAAVRALQAIEPDDDVRERAEQHLAHFAKKQKVENAGNDLAAVVQARRDSQL